MYSKRLTAVARIRHSSGKHWTVHSAFPFPLFFFHPKTSSYWKEELVQDTGTSLGHPWRPQSTHLCIKHCWHMLIWLCTSYRIASYFFRPFLLFVMIILKSKACLQIACSSSCTSYRFVTFSFLQPLKYCRKYWCALDLGHTSGPSFDMLFWLDVKPLPIISWEWIFNDSSSNLPVSPRTCYYSLLLKISEEIQGQTHYCTLGIRHLLLLPFSSGFWYCLGKNRVTWVV